MTIRRIRLQVLYTVLALTAAFAVLGFWLSAWWWLGLAVMGPLTLLGVWDLMQKRHSLLRTYPLVGHLRFLLEDTGPELRQYIVEANLEGKPFNRDQRSLMYQRAKDVADKKPFGTELDVYAETYAWLAHSMAPKPTVHDAPESFRVEVGGPQCEQPYSTSVFNISAMSFGSLSAAAVRAMNRGAKIGGFAQVTGEGGVSRYHLEAGGDLVWQIGTGYFGCRREDGGFDPDRFAETAAKPSIKMIELKISQGAKPGHGGILPGRKVTAEIADARGVAIGTDCISPAFHTEFGTPTGLCEFIGRLRELANGKPIGFKLCIGQLEEFFGVCKAMVETSILPDFITIDGAEGGTGAAPIEFCDRMGMPVKEGVVLAQNALVGINLRDKIRIAASGKLVTAFQIAQALALGADWCNSARGYMFAVGCIQAQACHTNECPVGVTTQDHGLQRALVVADKAERVANFHRNTVETLADVIAAAGLEHPSQLTPELLFQRTSPTEIRSFAELYEHIQPGQLLEGHAGERLQPYWDRANALSFT
jgi:glutamate synthase domain-containing protein 2